MAIRLLSPPHWHLPNGRRDRHTTWLETFYDLVFVVAVDALVSRLIGNTSLMSILQFIGLFLPVWWAWIGHTVYDTRYDTDDIIQRLFTFGMMLGAAAMAVQIPQAFEGQSAAFAAAYVFTRASLLMLYLRAWYYVPETRKITGGYLAGYGLGAGLWAVSIFVPPPARYAFWMLGLVVDLLTPWLIQSHLQKVPVDASHLPERLALFTTIILGEIITRVISSVAAHEGQVISLVAALLAFCLTVCIWWVYFTFIDVAPFAPNLGSGEPYIYTHMPILIGLALTSVGLARTISEAPSSMLPADTRWLLGVGIALWLSAGLALKLVSIRQRPSNWVIGRYLGCAICALLLMGLGASLPPLVLLGVLVLMLMGFTALDVRHWMKWSLKVQQFRETP